MPVPQWLDSDFHSAPEVRERDGIKMSSAYSFFFLFTSGSTLAQSSALALSKNLLFSTSTSCLASPRLLIREAITATAITRMITASERVVGTL